MTKEYDVKLALQGIKYRTFDYALHQTWVDDLARLYPYDLIVESFVWLYDNDAELLGRPFPINNAGRELYARMPERFKYFSLAR